MSGNAGSERGRSLEILERFGRYIVAVEEGERWVVVVGTGEGLMIRDAAALALFKQYFAHRRDVDFHYWRATRTRSGGPMRWRRVVWIGRPRLFLASSIGWLAQPLEDAFWGKYSDKEDGRSADSICYDENRFFERHQISETFEGVRLFDVDRALLALRRISVGGVEYVCVVIAGLGTLGSACLTKIVCDPVMSRELREQAEYLVGDASGCDPELGFEVLLKISVPDLATLDDLVNRLEAPAVAGTTAGRGFSFEVDAVALARENKQPKIWFAQSLSARRLTLVASGRGGEASLGSSWKRKLSAKRFRLLSLLNGVGLGIPAGELRAEMGYRDDRKGWGALHQFVYATNKLLAGDDAPADVRAWIESRLGQYTLHVRG